MKFLTLKRITSIGTTNFLRNNFISFSAIFVMTITLFVLGISLLVDSISNDILRQAHNRIDITVYFSSDADDELIGELFTYIQSIDAVSTAEYVSELDALSDYRARHIGQAELLRAVNELSANPFRARVNIYAEDASQYQSIAESIQSKSIVLSQNATLVDTIDFFENEEVIEGLIRFITSTQFLISGLVVIMFLASFFITFMTIRIAIHIHRDEIRVMNLVGASASYIRAPFVVEGILYGIVASLLAVGLLYPFVVWITPYTQGFLGLDNGFTLYYFSEFVRILGSLLIVGMIIGAISSILSVGKYLK